jgi:2-haloacid dehalogenase
MKTTLARRQFLSLTASAVAGALLEGRAASAVTTDLRVQAIAFDAFPVFDPRPVFAQAEQLFPGRGGELSNEWRTRQFEYTWLRVAAGHYADFWHITQDALEFAATKLSLELSPEKRKKLMSAYLELKPWPDVPAALASLKQSGFRLVFLSNFTRAMLDANIESAGLAGRFEQIISTDQAKTYKPDPRAYQLGVDSLKLRREEILFVAFAGWDAAGAKLFGYPTFWVNRQQLPTERLDATPDGVGESFTQLLQFLKV